MRGLKDKRVLITGGASGIGAATAARFLEEGSTVCVLDRDAAACERIRHALAGAGGGRTSWGGRWRHELGRHHLGHHCRRHRSYAGGGGIRRGGPAHGRG